MLPRDLERLFKGLSPRVRGNLRGGLGQPHSRGSIPACAGEPWAGSPANIGREVYPRVCGGTVVALRDEWAAQGLSPRVRGNRGGPKLPQAGAGSIPACAGEPSVHASFAPVRGVYPRVCGGTLGLAWQRQG